MNIIFATYKGRPEPSSNDSLVADWLINEGHRVQGVPWSEGRGNFDDADLIVIRSTWDYPRHLERFEHWLDDVRDLPIVNSVDLIKWNLRKSYLLELAHKGFNIPRSQVLHDPGDIDRVLLEWSEERGIIKPLIGASGFAVEMVQLGNRPDAFLLQEFVPEIKNGELSMAFFAGEFSHAVIKKPREGEFRVNSAFGGQIRAITPAANVIHQAESIVGSLPSKPLYARVDGVVVNDAFMLFELELIEPSFFFKAEPKAASRFGEAMLQHVLRSEVH